VKKRLVIVGGKGSGEIAMSIFEAANLITDEWAIEGYLADMSAPGTMLGRYPILGGSDETPEYVRQGYYIHYALQFNAKQKLDRVERFKAMDIPLEANATAIHPTVSLAPETTIGAGCVLCAFVASSFGASLGNFSHAYTGALMGHDCKTEEFVTLAAHSIVGARVLVREGAHVGLNSAIREDLIVGRYAIIGMGAVVIREVGDFDIVGGNPAKFLKKVETHA
jgi:sugar O-acyltransferase (sialic acid O-acetyltransferase NeuD family)